MSAVRVMNCKWLDAAVTLSAFHYQSSKFDDIRPPSFGTYPKLEQLRRRQHKMMSPDELESVLDKLEDSHEREEEKNRRSRRTSAVIKNLRSRLVRNQSFRFENPDINSSRSKKKLSISTIQARETNPSQNSTISTKSKNKSHFFLFNSKGPSNTNGVRKAPTRIIPRPSKNPKHPSLFLQEAAHLLSLNSAVAFATLRNDIEGSESPLGTFEAGQPFPPSDPDAYCSELQGAYWQKSRGKTILVYLLGQSRTQKMRTLYNAARPFMVIGGVSNAEIKLLQQARGPHAKLALCSLW